MSEGSLTWLLHHCVRHCNCTCQGPLLVSETSKHRLIEHANTPKTMYTGIKHGPTLTARISFSFRTTRYGWSASTVSMPHASGAESKAAVDDQFPRVRKEYVLHDLKQCVRLRGVLHHVRILFRVAWIASSSACRRTVSSAQSTRIQLPSAYSHARAHAMPWSVTRMMGGVNATAFMHEAEQILAMKVRMGAPRT